MPARRHHDRRDSTRRALTRCLRFACHVNHLDLEMSNDQLRAPVIGAGVGPTGLTLATELRRGGIDVLLLEQRSHRVENGSRAAGMQPRTIEMLDQRGVSTVSLRPAPRRTGSCWTTQRYRGQRRTGPRAVRIQPGPGRSMRPMNRSALSGLHHVKLPVTDLDASVLWYQRVVGAQHLQQWDHHDSSRTRYAAILETPGVDFPMTFDWSRWLQVVSLRKLGLKARMR